MKWPPGVFTRRDALFGGAEYIHKGLLQGQIKVVHRHGQAKINQAGDAIALNSAGHDAAEMAEFRLHIDGDAVETYPFAESDADGSNLVFHRAAIGERWLLRPRYPDADASDAPFAPYIERAERSDDPLFQRRDERAHIFATALQVEHHVSHALAGPVISVFAAATRIVNGKARRVDQVCRVGAGSRRIKRRVFDQPDQLAGGAGANLLDALLHEGERLLIGRDSV